VFPSQVPEALYLCRFLEARAPHAFVALGGPGLHQVAIHLEADAQKRLLAFADGIGLFEGEETLAQLFPRLEAWRAAESANARFEIVRDTANLMSVEHATQLPHLRA